MKEINQQVVETAKNVPTAVMNNLRKLFGNYKASNADLITAFVYAKTGGGFEINDKVKYIVAHYQGDKENHEIAIKLNKIERMVRKILEVAASIEIATAFTIADRLYTVKRAANPKLQEIRDDNALAILECARKAGKTQMRLDNEKIGREIHKIRSQTDYE